jgi:hypothetical protein
VPRNVNRADRVRRRPAGGRAADDDLDVVRQGLDGLGYYSGCGAPRSATLAAAVDLVKPQNPNRTQTIAYTTIANAKKGAPSPILFLSDGHPDPRTAPAARGRRPGKAAGIDLHDRAGHANGVSPGRQADSAAAGAAASAVRAGPARSPCRRPGRLRQIAQTTGGKFFDARSARR